MPRPPLSVAPGDTASPRRDPARAPLPALGHGAGGTRDGVATEGPATPAPCPAFEMLKHPKTLWKGKNTK